ncbi:unnamed protein product [Rotaria socialis]|uniref:Uncharacterized protein n=2 Tax=Rotaria socialis TaxID=392032 RepID=A0A820S4D9_9BILA|nr:unnamed protein product [Rotaria socialis]
MGSGPSSSSSNSSSEIRLSEKPDIRNFGTIVKISIYGNGLVHGGFWFGTHHVFSVLQTEKGIFTLLEVAKCSNGKINIHMGTAKSLSEVIKTRLNTQDKETFWRSDNVKISPLLVQQVIDEYHGNVYHPTVRSCRTNNHREYVYTKSVNEIVDNTDGSIVMYKYRQLRSWKTAAVPPQVSVKRFGIWVTDGCDNQ